MGNIYECPHGVFQGGEPEPLPECHRCVAEERDALRKDLHETDAEYTRAILAADARAEAAEAAAKDYAAEFESLGARILASEAREAAAGDVLRLLVGVRHRDPECLCDVCLLIPRAKAALSPSAASDHDARVRREALEEAADLVVRLVVERKWAAARDGAKEPPVLSCDEVAAAIRALADAPPRATPEDFARLEEMQQRTEKSLRWAKETLKELDAMGQPPTKKGGETP